MTAKQAITRSPGLAIEVNGVPTPWIAGGGYRGATAQLDSVVEQAAELLAGAYALPVVIRFNSDRRSGGAWLRTHKIDGFGANAEIGIGARLWSVEQQTRTIVRHEREIERLQAEIVAFEQAQTQDTSRMKLLGQLAEFEQRMLDRCRMSEPGVYVNAHIGTAALTDKTLGNGFAGDPDRTYYHGEHETLEDALAFVQQNGSLEHLDLSWLAVEA